MDSDIGIVGDDRDMPELLEIFHAEDERGVFAKPFSYSYPSIPFNIREIFWTASSRGTLRGMHVQVQPSAAAKLVWVSVGSVCDVLVDLRDRASFGQIRQYTLSAGRGNALYVPKGFGHGFQALEDNSIVNYATSWEFDPKCDTGVDAFSIGFDWPLPASVRSERDVGLLGLSEFRSVYNGGL